MIIIFSAFFPSLFRETKAGYLFLPRAYLGKNEVSASSPIFFSLSRRQEKQIFLDSRSKKEEEGEKDN